MDLAEYQLLSGLTVTEARQSLVEAQITRTQRILEGLLGFTLDPALYDSNKYAETGKTQTDCPCPSTTLTLDDPDAVVFAYRLFPYNTKDAYLAIDPATTIHAVKLIKDGVTYKTLDLDEYRAEFKNDIIKYLQQIKKWCGCWVECPYSQLAVDATWLWGDGDIPDDLNQVWAEMVTYYSDEKKDLISETMGPHSYRKHNQTATPPEQEKHNSPVITKYAGPNGSTKRNVTV